MVADRIYLMPVIGTGQDHDPRRPKYWSLFDGTERSMAAYGQELSCIAFARGISDAGHAAVIANSDVSALPVNLDLQIGAQLGNVQNALDVLGFPGGWVQANFTYRQVLRVVLLLCNFLQEFEQTLPNTRIFAGSITLDSRVNQIPIGARNALSATATRLGFDLTGLTGTTLIRTCLKGLIDQYRNIEVYFEGELL